MSAQSASPPAAQRSPGRQSALGHQAGAMARARPDRRGPTKPKIAIVNSSSGLAPCFSHLDPIAAAVKRSVEAAGGVAFEIRTVAPTRLHHERGRERRRTSCPAATCSPTTSRPSVEGAQLDGMVCLASCDKTDPRPARWPRPGSTYRPIMCLRLPELRDARHGRAGGHRGGVPARGAGSKFGGITFDGLVRAERPRDHRARRVRGMGTANSMHVVAEALGMTLPGSAPVRANSEPMWRAVEAGGAAIVGAVARGPPAAFDPDAGRVPQRGHGRSRGQRLDQLASSTCRRSPREAGLRRRRIRLFEKYADTIAAVRRTAQRRDTIEEFEDAGGTLARPQAARRRSSTGAALTVTGETIGGQGGPCGGRRRADHPAAERAARRPPDRGGGPRLARARRGHRQAVGRRGPAPRRSRARPASSTTPCRRSPRHRRGGYAPATSLVLRGRSARSAPPAWAWPRSRVRARRRRPDRQVAVVTDGQLSGLVNKGIVVGEVSPEGALPGPLGVVADGDRISIDLRARRADLLVDDAELARATRTGPGIRSPAGDPAGFPSTRGRSSRCPAARRSAATTSPLTSPDLSTPRRNRLEKQCRTSSPS